MFGYFRKMKKVRKLIEDKVEKTRAVFNHILIVLFSSLSSLKVVTDLVVGKPTHSHTQSHPAYAGELSKSKNLLKINS